MLKTPKAVVRVVIIVPLSKCFPERHGLAAHTKEILFALMFQALMESLPHVVFRLLFVKNILKTAEFSSAVNLISQ